jgi:hypothetical protein
MARGSEATSANPATASAGNYGATNPAVEAHAVLGRTMYDAVSGTANPTAHAHHLITPFTPADAA